MAKTEKLTKDKTVYMYDEYSGEYIGEGVARPCPVTHEVYHYPANSTADKPITAKKGKAVIFKDGAWREVDDHRGKKVYSKETGQEIGFVEFLNTELTENQTFEIPEDGQEWDGKKWITPKPVPLTDNEIVEGVKILARVLIEKSGHDWMAIRKISTGEDMPQNVLDYAAAVRAASEVLEAEKPQDYKDEKHWPTL